MNNLNLVVLLGRLAAPIEFRNYESGARDIKLLVTIDHEHMNKRRLDVLPVVWEQPTDTRSLAAWRSLEDHFPEVGDRVWVTGSIQRRWNDGEDKSHRLEVRAEAVTVQMEART